MKRFAFTLRGKNEEIWEYLKRKTGLDDEHLLQYCVVSAQFTQHVFGEEDLEVTARYKNEADEEGLLNEVFQKMVDRIQLRQLIKSPSRHSQ